MKLSAGRVWEAEGIGNHTRLDQGRMGINSWCGLHQPPLNGLHWRGICGKFSGTSGNALKNFIILLNLICCELIYPFSSHLSCSTQSCIMLFCSVVVNSRQLGFPPFIYLLKNNFLPIHSCLLYHLCVIYQWNICLWQMKAILLMWLTKKHGWWHFLNSWRLSKISKIYLYSSKWIFHSQNNLECLSVKIKQHSNAATGNKKWKRLLSPEAWLESSSFAYLLVEQNQFWKYFWGARIFQDNLAAQWLIWFNSVNTIL